MAARRKGVKPFDLSDFMALDNALVAAVDEKVDEEAARGPFPHPKAESRQLLMEHVAAVEGVRSVTWDPLKDLFTIDFDSGSQREVSVEWLMRQRSIASVVHEPLDVSALDNLLAEFEK